MSEAPAMKITILTIFPEMFESVLNSSILGRARAQGILDIRCVDTVSYTHLTLPTKA